MLEVVWGRNSQVFGTSDCLELLAPCMGYPELGSLCWRGLHTHCNYCKWKSNDCGSHFAVELKAFNGTNLTGVLIPFIRWGKQISCIHKPFLTLLLLLLSCTGAIGNEGIALEGRHIMQVFRRAGNCSLLTGIYLMICWSESQA